MSLKNDIVIVSSNFEKDSETRNQIYRESADAADEDSLFVVDHPK